MTDLEKIKKEAKDPFIMADASGLIVAVNKPFEEVFQWSEKEIVGKPLTTIIPKELHDAHQLGFSRFLTTQKQRIFDKPLNLKAVKKDGEVFDAEHIIHGEKQGEKWFFWAIIRPV